MSRQKRESRRFAICLASDDTDLLTPRKIYEVLPDTEAAKSDLIRVIDNEGEDYLYPSSAFVIVRLTPQVEQALRRAS